MASNPSTTCTDCAAISAAISEWQNGDTEERPSTTGSWHCDCGAHIETYRGGVEPTCPRCGAEYNLFGQRLRSGWRSNPSNWDDDVDDMEGFERAELAREGGR